MALDGGDGPVITTDPASPIYTNDHSIELFVHMTDVVPMTTGNLSFYTNGVLMEHYALWGMDGTTSHGEYMLLYPNSGINEYFITANDTAGHSTTIVVVIYRDVPTPSVQIHAPASGSYNNTGSATLSWTAHQSPYVDYFEIYVNGGKVATVGADTTSYTLTLEEGHDEIDVYVYDLAGSSAHASITMIVDRTGPLVEITSPSNGMINKTGNVTVQWLGANPLSGISHYEVCIDGGAPTVVSASVHEHAFDGLTDGAHTVFVEAVDNAGNRANDSVSFRVDMTAPTIVATSPTDGAPVDANITVTFSEEMDVDETSIAVNGVTGTLTWNGKVVIFAPSSPLSNDSEYIVNVTGKDLAGNTVSTAWTFTTAAAGKETGFDLTLVLIGAALAIVAVAAVLILMRKRA